MGEGESKDQSATADQGAKQPDDENWEPPQRDQSNGDGNEAAAKEDGEDVDISDTPAPSVGPNTTIDKEPPDERLARHEQSDVDAMGLDKRRQIAGGTYGPTVTRQIVTWVIVVAVIGGAAFGLSILASDLDKPPAKVEDQAPWTGSKQKPEPLQ